jgi:dihydrofolate reductase
MVSADRVIQEDARWKRRTTGIDNDFAAQSFENVGAWILGRNMFGPVRGPWKDDSWKGWWGDNPPYHTPVFVLTHHARPRLTMEGGTTFHFITDGLDSALKQAKDAADAEGTLVIRLTRMDLPSLEKAG